MARKEHVLDAEEMAGCVAVIGLSMDGYCDRGVDAESVVEVRQKWKKL